MRAEDAIPGLAFLAIILDSSGIDAHTALLIFATIAAIVGLTAAVLGVRDAARKHSDEQDGYFTLGWY
jgi:hypothetical protein